MEERGRKPSVLPKGGSDRVTRVQGEMNIASALALQSIAEVDQPLDIQSKHCLIYEGVSSPRPFARLFSMITKSYDKNLIITVNIYLNSYIVD